MSAPSLEAAEIPGLLAAVLAVEPAAIGGVVLHGSPGPVRRSWLALLKGLLITETPWCKVPVNATEERLLGGLDLAATLSAGKPIVATGLIAQAHGGVIELVMAERQSSTVIGALCNALDERLVRLERDGLTRIDDAHVAIVACDESREDDDPLDPRLRDRLALTLETDALRESDLLSPYDADDVCVARERFRAIVMPDEAYAALSEVAEALGLQSPRCVMLALNVARALAALDGVNSVRDADIATAALLALAMRVPGALEAAASEEQASDSSPESQPEPQAEDTDTHPDDTQHADDDRMQDKIDAAVQAVLPENMLAALAAQAARQNRKKAAGKSGVKQRANARGRPIGVVAGAPDGQQRLDLLATLKAAAPMQTMRGNSRRTDGRLAVRRDDLKVRRYQQKTRTTTIFVVDASGSAAVQRLAETKGAIELLLAECYVRRDQVALVAFRDTSAEAVLPPTRSLVRAKRALSALPGGGATPLGHGLRTALDTADAAAKRGETPLLVLMTDARANVGLDGERGSADADAHALAMASEIGERGYQVLAIDTGRRPGRRAQAIAEAMNARYLPLPYADASSVSAAVRGVAA